MGDAPSCPENIARACTNSSGSTVAQSEFLGIPGACTRSCLKLAIQSYCRSGLGPSRVSYLGAVLSSQTGSFLPLVLVEGHRLVLPSQISYHFQHMLSAMFVDANFSLFGSTPKSTQCDIKTIYTGPPMACQASKGCSASALLVGRRGGPSPRWRRGCCGWAGAPPWCCGCC